MGEPQSVRCTYAEYYNGQWDDPPFEPWPAPSWLIHAMLNGKILNAGDYADYACHWVQTASGMKFVAAGDTIRRCANGALDVDYTGHWALRHRPAWSERWPMPEAA